MDVWMVMITVVVQGCNKPRVWNVVWLSVQRRGRVSLYVFEYRGQQKAKDETIRPATADSAAGTHAWLPAASSPPSYLHVIYTLAMFPCCLVRFASCHTILTPVNLVGALVAMVFDRR